MTTATVEGIRTLSYIPKQGQQFLSVNLAMVDLTEISNVAKQLGFKLELVQIPSRSGVQIHALLWEGAIADAPSDMGTRIDQLADLVDPHAIRSARGAWTKVA